MRVNIKDLLEYFDLKSSSDYGDTTAAISVVGEDLGAAIFKHFLENTQGASVEIMDPNFIIPTTLQRIGRSLDRWILSNENKKSTLYQAEIKSWCARAIGGVDVPINCDSQTLNRLAELNWLKHIVTLESKDANGLNKVLVNMINDSRLLLKTAYVKEPLLIYWHACKPSKEKDFFFKYKLKSRNYYYDYCWNFSCSLYLRDLLSQKIEYIELDMPNLQRRINQLNKIFKFDRI